MLGYWRNEEATRAAIDAEGWLATGDLAELRDGKIYIRGRAKDILVMSNGEKLPPQDAELAILRDPVFEQVMLIGEGTPVSRPARRHAGDRREGADPACERPARVVSALGARAPRHRDARAVEH